VGQDRIRINWPEPLRTGHRTPILTDQTNLRGRRLVRVAYGIEAVLQRTPAMLLSSITLGWASIGFTICLSFC
jgi:hypothetical protein